MHLAPGYSARPLGPRDYELFYQWYAQEDFCVDTPDPARESEAHVRELMEFPRSYLLLVEDEGGSPCAIMDVIFRHGNRVADLDVGYGPGFTDPGKRQAVFEAVTRLLLSETCVLRVQKYVYEFEEEGRARCEASGYRLEARLRRHVFRRGRWWDLLVYGLLRGDAAARGATVAKAGGAQ